MKKGWKVYTTISIHAPREGGDFCFAIVIRLIKDFNPRPPRGGRRSKVQDKPKKQAISIHAPREGGDKAQDVSSTYEKISIHAPREGGDQKISL